nr:MAG TPA: hypothetical protein [Caudoviricetes sp.]
MATCHLFFICFRLCGLLRQATISPPKLAVDGPLFPNGREYLKGFQTVLTIPPASDLPQVELF